MVRWPTSSLIDINDTDLLGFLYEMGGTWVTHHMGYLLREMMRYDLDRELITTGSPDMHKGFYTIDVPG